MRCATLQTPDSPNQVGEMNHRFAIANDRGPNGVLGPVLRGGSVGHLGPDLGDVTRAKQGCAGVAMSRPNADRCAPDRGGLQQPWVGYPPHVGGEGGRVSEGLSRQGKHKKSPDHSRSRMIW